MNVLANVRTTAEHALSHLGRRVPEGDDMQQASEAEQYDAQDQVVASIEIVHRADGTVEKTIKKNAAGEILRVIEADEDMIAGTGIR
ncbi:hypothetical protein [Streptomyces sp. NPDC059071]|uniref:hypothetical protein n=1 Tax=unclassified Streptomyces TaxID=2593676 RepID=UPI0036625290